MSDLSIQFHATSEEISSFATECAKEFDLHLAAIRFQPFEVISLDQEGVREALSDTNVRRLAFTAKAPALPAEASTKFLDKNPDALLLELGQLSDNGLEESWLRVRTFNKDAFEIWKKVARKLKRRTQTGVLVINPNTGEAGMDRVRRFTSGAKALQDQGVVMIPLAGSCIFRLGGEVAQE